MKFLGVAALLLTFCGCEPQGKSPVGKLSRLNEFSFKNSSGKPLSKVVVHWNSEQFTITNENRALEAGSRQLQKLPIREPLETTFKIVVHLANGEETVVHEESVSLDPGERKLVDVVFASDGKIYAKQKQRNPNILPAR